jgi:hypothetical protein
VTGGDPNLPPGGQEGRSRTVEHWSVDGRELFYSVYLTICHPPDHLCMCCQVSVCCQVSLSQPVIACHGSISVVGGCEGMLESRGEQLHVVHSLTHDQHFGFSHTHTERERERERERACVRA